MVVIHLATKTAHGPYLLDLGPASNDDLNPRTAVLKFAQRWRWPSVRLHLLHDSGFCREDMSDLLRDLACSLSCSCTRAGNEWLFNLLDRVCGNGKWVAVQDRNGGL